MPTLLEVAAPNVRSDPNWISRAKIELLSKPETAELLLSTRGLESSVYAIIRAATVGVNFGGTKPQAYFVPADGKVRLDISQYGYCAAAVYGPGAVLSQVPELITVHQNDGIRIDQSKGEILFPVGGIDPFCNRGKLVGWIMRMEFKDGRQAEVKYLSFEKARQIEETHGQTGSPSYKKDRDQMDEKIAVKQLLKRVFAEAEGRSQMNLDSIMDEPNSAIIERDPEKLREARFDLAVGLMSSSDAFIEDPVSYVHDNTNAGSVDEIIDGNTSTQGTEELF
jgi:recombinational DNA repair protein RecT